MENITKEELFALLDEWAAVRLPVLVAMALDDWFAQREAGQPPVAQLSEIDAWVAKEVGRIWRDWNQKPATTAAIAHRLGYSPKHTLQLCKAARDNGAISEVPGRGQRCSGRWVPVAA